MARPLAVLGSNWRNIGKIKKEKYSLRKARLALLKFGMTQCVVDIYQVRSNIGPGVQYGAGLKNKIFFSNHWVRMFSVWYVALPSGPWPNIFIRITWLICLNFGIEHCRVVFYSLSQLSSWVRWVIQVQ